LQDKLEKTTISLSDRKSSWISIKSDLEAEITEYVSNVGELSARLDELTNENQRLNSELRSSVEELDEAKEAKTKTYNALTEAQQTIAFLQNELSQIPALKEKINSLEEALEKAGQAKLIKTWRELAEDDEDWSLWLSDMPIKQILFCDIIAEYNTLLDEALASQNQIRTNLVLKERKLELDGLLPRGELEGWVARVHAVTQTERGDAAVLLELPCSTNVGSGITSLRGEESWAATIPYGDRMYRELVKVGKGDFVIFNASLLEIDEGELGQPEYKFASNLKADKKLPQAFQTDRETFIAIIGYLVEAKR
jgi:regulator of replication initiation timing